MPEVDYLSALAIALDHLRQAAEGQGVRTILLGATGVWAGLQNALAGGGSFVTLPALMAMGLSPLEANITSTVALFPGQVVSGGMGYRAIGNSRPHAIGWLILISLLGGILGGWLLIGTPADLFRVLLPWLVLFATLIFIWGSYIQKPAEIKTRPNIRALFAVQFLIAIYGGYFGGGIGFLMLAALTLSGFATRTAGSLKNIFAAVMNLSATGIFMTSPALSWTAALVLGSGALIGFSMGSHWLRFINERWLRAFVILIGFSLTAGLFIEQNQTGHY